MSNSSTPESRTSIRRICMKNIRLRSNSREQRKQFVTVRATKHVAAICCLSMPSKSTLTNHIDSEYRSFKLWPKAFARMTGESNLPHFPNLVVNDAPLFRALLDLHTNLEQDGSALEQESQFISTIALLLERQTDCQFGPDKGSKARKEDSKIRLVRDYLRDHYAENVSLSQLTSLTNLSPFYLLRVFRSRAGFPPHEYQTQVRIAHARRLIRSGTPLSQTAIETGFFDQSHLSRNFKRIVGVTPRQYFRG